MLPSPLLQNNSHKSHLRRLACHTGQKRTEKSGSPEKFGEIWEKRKAAKIEKRDIVSYRHWINPRESDSRLPKHNFLIFEQKYVPK